MLPYAAYLRVYEPVTAFPEPERSLWAVYADSPRRPRRVDALGVEHREALRRLAGTPPEPAPGRESRDAYVRRHRDAVYVCPWQTRLRSWLALARFLGDRPASVAAAFVPPETAGRAVADFERWKLLGRPLEPYIRSSRWHVPVAWFAPFGRDERRLTLSAEPVSGTVPGGAPAGGACREEHAGSGAVPGPTSGTAKRTLIYVTSMSEARARVDRALGVVRASLGAGVGDDRVYIELETVGRWLAAFHREALVELDYGGLVHLLDDDALRADESAAETAVAVAALERGSTELAVAMYKRLLARWRPLQALETAN